MTADGPRNYSYDATGNRTLAGYQTGTGNRLTSDGTWAYTYDHEGNLTKKSKGASAATWTYGYDHRNQMVWAELRATDGGTLQLRVDFKYDVFGRRMEKAVDPDGAGAQGTTTTRFAYHGEEVWADLNGSNALQTRYLHGDVVDQLFARLGANGTAAWYLTDRQGSVRDVADASGAVLDHLEYTAFGKVLSESNPSFGDRYKYTGREFDSETGLGYFRARYYDPETARWTTEDPIRFAAGDSNLYRYVRNSSTLATDPSGLDYRSDFERAIGVALPSDWRVHHTLQQRLRERYKAIGINVDDVTHLRAIHRDFHKDITDIQNTWRDQKMREMGLTPRKDNDRWVRSLPCAGNAEFLRRGRGTGVGSSVRGNLAKRRCLSFNKG